MTMDDVVYVAACEYRTDKTLTRDIVAVTPHGVLSVKIVESANGHKTNVYSGFDTPADAMFVYDLCLEKSGKFYHDDFDHKYRNSQYKAVEKWKGDWLFAEEMTRERMIELLNLEGAINGKVAEHFEMAFGPSGSILSASIQATAAMIDARTAAAERAEQAMKNDPTWGMF